MLSKPTTEKPYYSEGPLCQRSKWVAFPLELELINKSYKGGLNTGRRLITTLTDELKTLSDLGCTLEKPAITEGEAELETFVEFRKSNGECMTLINHLVFIQFTAGTEFWSKMEITGGVLDAIEELSQRFVKDKAVSVRLGIKFQQAKFLKQ